MSKVNDINNITLPVYKRLKKDLKKAIEIDVPGMIEASQDIISQLAPIYNSETEQTRIVFPPNILPLRFYSDETDNSYFKYNDEEIYDQNGYVIGQILFETISNKKCVVLLFDDEFTSLTNANLTYCYFNDYEYELNTYNLYYPQEVKSIYIHPIVINKQTGNEPLSNLSLFIFNNDSSPYTLSSLADYIIELYNTVGSTLRFPLSGGLWYSDKSCVASFLGYDGTNFYIRYLDVTNNDSSNMTIGNKTAFINMFTTIQDGVNKIN